jgi:hypothetical protein
MALTATPEMTKEIKRHKRLLERENLYTYAYKHGDCLYSHVLYLRFGKATGSLILSDCPNPSREDLIRADQAFFHFNRIIIEARTRLIRDAARPIDLVQDTKRDLQQAQGDPLFSLDAFRKELTDVYTVFDTVIGVFGELESLFKAMQALEKRVLDRGYMTDEGLEEMIGYNLGHSRVMYHQGRELVSILPVMKRLREHMDSLKGRLGGEREKLRRQLATNLGGLTHPKSVKTLMQSQSTYEKDALGNTLVVKPGDEGLRQIEEIARKDFDYVYRTRIQKDLRNLQDAQ